MQSLDIKAEKSVYRIPRISFDVKNGECWIEGESNLEDTELFYRNLADWLKFYIRNIKKPIYFHLKLYYFNTSSQKGILQLLKLLRFYKDNGGQVTVYWHYKENDDESLEEAEDFMIDCGLKFQLATYP